jgi:predicted PurR-regulated permease PerM
MPEQGDTTNLDAIRERPWLWRWGIYCWLGLGIVGAIVVAGLVYGKARDVIIPLVVAIILGILLEPLVNFMTHHRIPRPLATAVVMILIIVIIGGFIALVAYSISTQARAIGSQISDGITKLRDWLNNLKVSPSTSQWIKDQIDKVWPAVQNGLANELARTAPGFASFLIGSFISFFILLFILGDDGRINRFVAGHMGVSRDTGEFVLNEVFTSFRDYFKGTTIIAIVDAILISIVVLILRVPLAPAIALVTFVTCYIPSFGGYIGGAFAVLIALAAKGVVPALIVLVFAIIIHTIMQAPVQAYAYGKTLKLHPLLALLMTLLGAVFAGIFGAILAVPLTAVVLKVHSELKRVRAGATSEEVTAESE